MDRKLSGIFVRVRGPEKWENKDITDCTEEQIKACMAGQSAEELIGWVVTLCQVFRQMGDALDIVRE
jgi:hypothetical protein